MRPRLSALLLLAVLIPAATAARPPAVGEALVGRSLTDALLLLQERGLDLIFTSEVVTPDMRVEAEPRGDELPQLLADLLAPHGLIAREAPGGIFVVLPGAPPPQPRVLHRVEDEIVVRPSRVSLLENEPAGPFAFGPDELASLPHLGGDAFRAMAVVPGTATNDVTARFSVRGGRPDEVLIRLDGQELYEPYHLQDYDSALSIVPSDALAGVTLATGGFPVSRGDRMGGVLDLRSPSPATPRRTRLGVGLLSARATTSGGFAGDRGGWSVTARRGSAELAEDLTGEESPRFWGVFGRADLELHPGQRLSLRALASDDELDLHESVDGETKRFDTGYDSRYLWLTHEGLLGRRIFLETRASWAATRRNRGGDEMEEEGSFAIRDTRRTEVLGFEQAASIQADEHHVVEAGWEARRFETAFRYDNLLDRELTVVAPFSPPRPETFSFRGTLEGTHLGAWISHSHNGLGRLSTEIGVRFDRHTLTDDSLWSPRLNTAWRLGERSLVRASWGRFHQSQRPYELLVEDGETALQRAERSDHWVVGYERILGQGRRGGALRVELFRRRIDNPRERWVNLLEPINVFPEIEPDRVRLAPRRSSAQGVEILLRGGLGRGHGWLAYTWSESRNHLDGRRVPRPLDQTHAVVAHVSHRLGRHWNLALAWHYHTGWPTTPVGVVPTGDEEPRLVPAFGEPSSQRLPDYHRLDVRASRVWELRGSTLELFVDVQNLYDRQNVGGYDLDFDEEAGTVALEPEPWPGILPSLGLVWEF